MHLFNHGGQTLSLWKGFMRPHFAICCKIKQVPISQAMLKVSHTTQFEIWRGYHLITFGSIGYPSLLETKLILPTPWVKNLWAPMCLTPMIFFHQELDNKRWRWKNTSIHNFLFFNLPTQVSTYGVFILDVKLVFDENLSGILGGTQC